MRVHSLAPHRRQQGMILVVSLIILLLLTITGLASMQNSSLQEKMAGNNHDHEQAFFAAETALRAGETYLAENVSTIDFTEDGTNGFYDRTADEAEAVEWQSATNWQSLTSRVRA